MPWPQAMMLGAGDSDSHSLFSEVRCCLDPWVTRSSVQPQALVPAQCACAAWRCVAAQFPVSGVRYDSTDSGVNRARACCALHCLHVLPSPI